MKNIARNRSKGVNVIVILQCTMFHKVYLSQVYVGATFIEFPSLTEDDEQECDFLKINIAHIYFDRS